MERPHILSEIALLADDIGIIDHGVLLEENNMSALEKKNRKYILLRVSDMSKAMLILEQECHVTDFPCTTATHYASTIPL